VSDNQIRGNALDNTRVEGVSSETFGNLTYSRSPV
jgi:hypothetical protein